MVVCDFVTSRLNCCNAPHCGVNQSALACLQYSKIQKKKRERLHYFSVGSLVLALRYTIQYKGRLFVFIALNVSTPAYVVDTLHPCTPSRSLRPASQSLCPILQSKLLLKKGVVPLLSLYQQSGMILRNASTVTVFEPKLNTCLFVFQGLGNS